eukprot:5466283-Pleurochrysis_carterae.AAC.1
MDEEARMPQGRRHEYAVEIRLIGAERSMAASMLLLLSAAFQPSTGSLNATAPPQLRVLLPKGASAVARGR